MKPRMFRCKWCEKEYASANSTARSKYDHCSFECDDADIKASLATYSWREKIHEAWEEYHRHYIPDADEFDPSDWFSGKPITKKTFPILKKKYEQWSRNHCWKKSFWLEDDSVGKSSKVEVGTKPIPSSSTSNASVRPIVRLIFLGTFFWLVWKGVKCGWNWLFGGDERVDPEVVMLNAWEEHLNKRCAAFADGLSENQVEAKGLCNYTWLEWQEKTQKERTLK